MEKELSNAASTKEGLTWSLILPTLICTFGSSFQNGYHFWVIHYPNVFILNFYRETYQKQNIVGLQGSILKHLWHLNVSFFPLGGIIGSLFITFLADHCGRKATLLINGFFSIISTGLIACSKVAHTYEFIIFAHMVVGVCAGISSSVVPMYLAEVAPQNLRGGIVLVDRLLFTIGILVAQVVGLQKIFGDEEGWVIHLSLTGIPAAFQIFLLPLCPESPRYLLIQKRDEEKARQVLKKLRGWDDVENEIEELYDEDLCDETEKPMSPLKLIGFYTLRSNVCSVIVMITSHQLGGIHLVYFYMEKIYTSTGVQQQDMWYIATPVTMLLVLVTMVMRNIPWMSYFSTAFAILFLFGQAIGPGPVPILMTSELFLQSSRASGCTIGGLVHWILCFISDLTLHILEQPLRSYTFLVISLPVAIATFYYVFKAIPETKKLSFLEIRGLLVIHKSRKILVRE